MRIAQVCPYDWDRPGGVQEHVRTLARRLVARGPEVGVPAPGGGPAPDERVRLVGRSTGVPFNGSVAPVCLSPAAWPAVRRELRAFAPDVVHVHAPFAPSLSRAAAKSAPAPVLATFPAYYEPHSAHDLIYAAARPLLRPVWRRLATRVAVSDAAAEIVRRRMGTTPRVVPNGVEVARFADAIPARAPEGRRLLFVGRLERRKGFAVAVAAFAEMARRERDLHLIVVGEGPERAAVEQLDPGVRARVRMLGRVSDEELPGWYASADLFLAPATGQESFGIVLVEAMAAGVPVVASDVAGYRAVLDGGRAGLLVPPGSPEALAAGASRLLADATLRARLRRGGRRRAADFSWETVCTRIELIYAEMARAATHGPWRLPERLPTAPAPARAPARVSAEG